MDVFGLFQHVHVEQGSLLSELDDLVAAWPCNYCVAAHALDVNGPDLSSVSSADNVIALYLGRRRPSLRKEAC